MHPYPHVYTTTATAGPEQAVRIDSPGLSGLDTTPPPEFGGPGGHWSPETLLVASVADCFILTFRAIAKASKLDWVDLSCEADGTLDRVEGVTKFTRFDLRARLVLPAGADADKAEKILHKSESACLVTNSMSAELDLQTVIETR